MIKLFGLLIIILTLGTSYSWDRSSEYQEMDIGKAYAVSRENPCNCTLDSVHNRAGFELPKVQVLQSAIEHPLEWTESKEISMDGIIVGNTYLGNYSAGDLVDLSTIKVTQDQLLGLEITDGTLPDIVSAEVVNSTTPMNNTDLRLGEIVIDKKIYDSFVLFNKSLQEPTSDENSFRLQIPPQGGNFVLIVSLLYNYDSNITNNNNSGAAPTQTDNFLAIYKAVLSVDTFG